jgi:hypothetical protein
MSKSFNISLPESEMRKFRAWVNSEQDRNTKDCQQLIDQTARKIVSRAKQFASRFTHYGFLEASIGAQIIQSRMGAEITAGGPSKGVYVKYAPYVEFGTGTKVSVGSDVKDYAIQFKGRGIRKVNNAAQPYFFPALRISVKEMEYRLGKLGFR